MFICLSARVCLFCFINYFAAVCAVHGLTERHSLSLYHWYPSHLRCPAGLPINHVQWAFCFVRFTYRVYPIGYLQMFTDSQYYAQETCTRNWYQKLARQIWRKFSSQFLAPKQLSGQSRCTVRVTCRAVSVLEYSCVLLRARKLYQKKTCTVDVTGRVLKFSLS